MPSRGVGRGGTRPEAASTWVARDMNTHIELTARLVEHDLHTHNRLAGVSLAPIEAEPWSQELLGLTE
jgi:hypothetical protein